MSEFVHSWVKTLQRHAAVGHAGGRQTFAPRCHGLPAPLAG
ncbi:hypothetical protein [Solirubrobacter pauli]|nr:hypothetical protein [Solirubrobacter pauli]